MNILQTIKSCLTPRFQRPRTATAALWLALLTTVVVVSPMILLVGCGKQQQAATDVIWTCSMHPQIRRNKPGICPICDMKLIPDDGSSKSQLPRQYSMHKAARALAEIETTKVQRMYATNTIRMVGKVAYDEKRVTDITAWVPGRLDRLFVDYTGVTVKKGYHMVIMYSPDLMVTQKELILAVQNFERFGKGDKNSTWYANITSAEERLRLAGLLQEQIEQIKKSKTPSEQITINAPSSGIVIEKRANQGAYVQTGTRIYTIADLSQVWVNLDAFESDLKWLRYGQEVEFDTESEPGVMFTGRIAFIDPILNEKTRTVKIRVNVPNKNMRLKPGMFVRARVKSKLAMGGQVIDPSLAGKWISPMHSEIIKDGPGKCDICGMALVPAEELGFVTPEAGRAPLVIPASAPLITGKRAVVYVKLPPKKETEKTDGHDHDHGDDKDKVTYVGRTIRLGDRVDDYYIVLHGLQEGEEVVTRGAFKIDAALQIRAQASMMNPQGGPSSTGHEHHGGIKSAAGKTADKKVEIEVPAKFRLELDPVYRIYLASADALAKDDLAKSHVELKKLIEQTKQVASRQLNAAGRSRWKTVSDRIVFAAYDAVEATDRPATRKHFLELSDAMLEMVHTFGHALKTPIYQFQCTMAFDNTGGSWLQASDKAQNPFFGPKMLDCGDRKATFFPDAPLVVTPQFRKQLSPLYAAYLKLHLAMTKDPKKAKDLPRQFDLAMQEIKAALKNVDAASLDRRSTQTWHIAHKKLTDSLAKDFKNLKAEAQHRQFESIAAAMLGVVDNFGHDYQQLLHKAHCPMAFDNRGAVWLQAGDKIVNPYFSGTMLNCGNIQRDYPTANAKEIEKPKEPSK